MHFLYTIGKRQWGGQRDQMRACKMDMLGISECRRTSTENLNISIGYYSRSDDYMHPSGVAFMM